VDLRPRPPHRSSGPGGHDRCAQGSRRVACSISSHHPTAEGSDAAAGWRGRVGRADVPTNEASGVVAGDREVPQVGCPGRATAKLGAGRGTCTAGEGWSSGYVSNGVERCSCRIGSFGRTALSPRFTSLEWGTTLLALLQGGRTPWGAGKHGEGVQIHETQVCRAGVRGRLGSVHRESRTRQSASGAARVRRTARPPRRRKRAAARPPRL
jgi:hypothetical protein